MAVHTDPRLFIRALEAKLYDKSEAYFRAFEQEIARASKREAERMSEGPLSGVDRKRMGYPYALDRGPYRYSKNRVKVRQAAPFPDYIINIDSSTRNDQGGMLHDAYKIQFRRLGNTVQYRLVNTQRPDNIVLKRQGRGNRSTPGTRGSNMRSRGFQAELNRRMKRKLQSGVLARAWRNGGRNIP